MALTLRQNGSTSANLITAQWWNDYYDLLTGAMTDQPVTLAYAPGASGSTPTLALKGNGNGPLLAGYDTDGTTVRFSVDHAGNVSTSGTLSAAQVTDGGRRVAVQGSHSSGQTVISWGTGQPSALDANEIFIQFS